MAAPLLSLSAGLINLTIAIGRAALVSLLAILFRPAFMRGTFNSLRACYLLEVPAFSFAHISRAPLGHGMSCPGSLGGNVGVARRLPC